MWYYTHRAGGLLAGALVLQFYHAPPEIWPGALLLSAVASGPADSFKPDSGSFEAAKVIVTVIAFIAGIAASVYFAIGIIKVVVKDVKELISGEASLKDKQPRFIAIGAGFMILLLVITGKWYDVIVVIWNKIILPIIDKVGN